MKDGSYQFWIYTKNYDQNELNISIYKDNEFLDFYFIYFEQYIKDLVIINDNVILFLFVIKSKIMLKIIDTNKIILKKGKKDKIKINDKDFISIFTYDLLDYDENNYEKHKILFNEKGNILILLVYGTLNFLNYNKETYKFQLMSKFGYKTKINTFLVHLNNIIYVFTDSYFFIFDIDKNKILKEISYCEQEK